MRIGFVVNDMQTEHAVYTTTRLSMAAVNRGHQAWTLGVGDFIYEPKGSLGALARSVSGDHYDSLEAYMSELQGSGDDAERISVDTLDVLMLRNDPSTDKNDRSWAQTSGILFGQLAMRHGVLVLNDPVHLATAINKTYFQYFPKGVRPMTCISRSVPEIKQFIAQHDGNVVIKPLQGSGGRSVFVIHKEDKDNVNQMIEAVIRDGYCLAQEYLPAAAEGDVRMFLMNGRPLMHEGKYAAFRRVNATGDTRSNMSSGGRSEAVDVDPTMLHLAEMVRPKLVQDGMFLVGLDIVGDKLMEVNVFTPGGLGSVQQHTGVDFADVIIRDMERKVQYRKYYRTSLSNVQLASI